MALIAFSPLRTGTDDTLPPFERLLLRVSTAFGTLGDDASSVSRTIEEVAVALGADECVLVAFRPRGERVDIVASWAAHPYAPCGEADVAGMTWTLQRLARNAIVTMTPTAELPAAAESDRAHAARSGVVSRLAVPITWGSRVAFALLIASRHRRAEWDTPTVERVRIVGELLAAGLVRRQQEDVDWMAHAHEERRQPGASAVAMPDPSPARDDGDIVGASPALQLPLARLAQVAPVGATVLLLGETGTGKELFARALHQRSPRRDRPLVRVNCAALPPTLIESELFGHEKGAFTGAVAARQGRFELADGGTIFLDEIGDLAHELQAKLLRVLQEGEFERVGSSKTRRVDVRIVAGTHVDLERAVAEGRFRADLYYRLSVFPIALPPLRDRVEDIPELVWRFIHRRQRALGRHIVQVPADVVATLQRHDWPGNVRELENVIERALIHSVDGTLRLDEPPRPRALEPLPSGGGDRLDAVQRAHIERVLRDCGGRINGIGNAAARLGLHPNTLRFRMKKLGVITPERGGAMAS